MDPAPDERFARHLSLERVGAAGQARIEAAAVLIVGLGGLGSPAALYLAAAGIGRLVLADFDVVEVSNLQRQIAHATDRVGRAKVDSAREACLALNPDVDVECVERALDAEELAALVPTVDVVLDCSDNFDTRAAVNAAAVAAGRPLVTGAAIRFDGQLAVIDPRVPGAPCWRCLYGDAAGADDGCVQAGILGPVVGTIGTLQALEAIKLVVGLDDATADDGVAGDGAAGDATPDGGPAGRLLLFDGLSLAFDEIRYRRRPDCPVCAGRP